MNNLSDIFEKIIVDGDEINLQSLESVRGKWGVGGQKNVTVDFILRDNTIIPSDTFNRLKQLKYAYLPKSITTIGSNAFYGSKLSYINNLSYVINIGDHAFSYTYLTYINGLNSNQNISENAFSYIDTLTEESKEYILSYQPNSYFGEVVQESNTDNQNNDPNNI